MIVNSFANKFLISLSLLIFSQITAAWELVVSRGGSNVYIEKSSIRHDGDVVQALWISSSDKPFMIRASGNYMSKQSIKYLTSYDCIGQQFYNQEVVWYDEPMAKGQGHTISSRIKPQWIGQESKRAKGNLNVDIMKFVCNKK